MTFEEAQAQFPGLYSDEDRGQFEAAQAAQQQRNVADNYATDHPAVSPQAQQAIQAVQNVGMGNQYNIPAQVDTATPTQTGMTSQQRAPQQPIQQSQAPGFTTGLWNNPVQNVDTPAGGSGTTGSGFGFAGGSAGGNMAPSYTDQAAAGGMTRPSSLGSQQQRMPFQGFSQWGQGPSWAGGSWQGAQQQQMPQSGMFSQQGQQMPSYSRGGYGGGYGGQQNYGFGGGYGQGYAQPMRGYGGGGGYGMGGGYGQQMQQNPFMRQGYGGGYGQQQMPQAGMFSQQGQQQQMRGGGRMLF